MVYISSPMISTASRQSVMQAQSDLATAQTELSSGTLADAGLTLGGRSGRLVSLRQDQADLQSITDTNSLVSTQLGATSSALDTIRTAAQTMLTSLSSTAATGSASTLSGTALSSLSALTAALNTTVSGRSIFAGINTATPPMTAYSQSPASANKQAVDDAFATAFGTSQTSGDASSITGDGMTSFLNGSFANLFSASGYSSTWSSASDQTTSAEIAPGQTISTSVSANAAPFRQLAQAYTMVSEFSGSNLSADARNAVIQSAVSLVSSALSGLTNMQAGVGVSQAAVSNANDNMAAQLTLLSTQQSDLDGVDSYALSTKVTSLQTQIQASYEITAQLQKMSLVNYL